MREASSTRASRSAWRLPFGIDLLGFTVILILFGPGLIHFFAISFSPDFANDDSRQWTWPLLRYSDPSLFVGDPIADYYLNALLPSGYHFLMRELASVVDAVPLATAVGHVSLIVALLFAFLTGRFLAGAIGGWICVGLILANGELLEEWTAGGFPRSTGLALSFTAMYGFLCDRRLYTGLATILGALFWYPIIASAGALFAIQCLTPGSVFGWRDPKSLAKRVTMVFIVACVAFAISAPKVLFPSQWGPVIPNTSSVWPEAGMGGRFAPEDQLGLGRPSETVREALRAGFRGPHPWLDESSALGAYKDMMASGIVSLQLMVLFILGWTRPIARRLLAVVAVSIVLYVLAIVLAPMLFVPSRFVHALIPWVNIFSFVYLGSEAGSWLSGRWRVSRNQVQALLAAIVIFMLGGRPYENGYDIKIGPTERQALNFISEFPKTALIAGWPDGIIDDIPLFSRRRVLLSYETHLAFHEAYLRDKRAKAKAVIDAWLSPDGQALAFLRDHYGVTHFVIEKERRADRSLSYFRPFDQYIAAKRSSLAARERWIDAPRSESVVFENNDFIIIDLGKLAATDQ